MCGEACERGAALRTAQAPIGGGYLLAGDNDARKETIKLEFEFFKHLTTLSTAAALVLLAVFRDVLDVQQEFLRLGVLLTLLSVSLMSSLMGMYDAVFRMSKPLADAATIPQAWLYNTALVPFVVAVGTSVLVAFGLVDVPWWGITIIVLVAVLAILGALRAWVRRQQRTR